jgi:hypothetical protein
LNKQCKDLQAVDKPGVQGVGYKLVDPRVAETEYSKGRPLSPIVYLKSHEDSFITGSHVHVPHVKSTKIVKNSANCQHPGKKQRYSPSLVVKEKLYQAYQHSRKHGLFVYRQKSTYIQGNFC